MRTDTGKAAGISHIPLTNPGTAGPVDINLGSGSVIRVKGSGPNAGGGVPQPQTENNFAIGIGIWQRDLKLQADQLTLDVQSEKSDAYGISKSTGSNKNHDISLGKNTLINVKAGNTAYGVSLDSAITTAGLPTPSFQADALTIKAEGGGAYALQVRATNGGTSTIDLGSNTRLTAIGNGGSTRALDMSGQTKLSATDLTLEGRANNSSGGATALYLTGLNNTAILRGTTNIESTGMGVYSYGVMSGYSSQPATQMTFDQVHVKAGSYGMNIQGRVNLDLGTGSTIESNSLAGMWLIANRQESASKINMKADALEIRGVGRNTAGLDVRGNAIANINAASFVQVENGVGLYADDSGQIFFHGSSTRSNYLDSQRIGAYAVNNGKIDLNRAAISVQRAAGSSTGVASALTALNRGRIEASDTNIFFTSDDAAQANYVVYANTNGKMILKDTVINTTGSSAAANVTGIVANGGGQIESTGSLYNNMASPSDIAFLAQGANSIIQATGEMGIYGTAQAKDKGDIRLNFESGSTWQGGALKDSTGKIAVSLVDSRWTPTQTSAVDSLFVSNSTVDLREMPTDSTLTVNSPLVGSGGATVMFRPRISPSNPDNFDTRLILNNLTQDSRGKVAVSIANDGAFQANSRHAWTIVNTTGAARPDVTFYTNYAIELGGYLYAVKPHENGKDWQVVALGDETLPPKPDEDGGSIPPPPPPIVDPWDPDPVDPPDPIDPTDPIDPVDPNPPGPGPDPDPGPGPGPKPEPELPKSGLTTTTAKAAANMFSIGYLMNIAEQQTLMQRMGDLRLNGDKLHNFWMRGYGGHYNGFARQKLDGFKMNYYGMQMGLDRRLGNLPVYTGAFVGYTHGDPKPTGGSAKAKSYYGGVYATYINEDSGIYVDGVLKFNRFKHNFTVEDTQRQQVMGDTSTNGLSASLEVGKRFHFNVPKQGWYLEPQVLYTYSRVNSTEFTATNGLNIHLGSYNSNIGRYGFSLGYEMSSGKTEYNLYWKTAFVREFSGRGHYTLNGEKEDHYFRGNWWSNGLGINARIDQRHDLYLEVDTNRGKSFNTVNVNAGYRFIF